MGGATSGHRLGPPEPRPEGSDAPQLNDERISWASDIGEGTVRQAEKAARLPIVAGHVALMPDAHVGLGATVGSVIPAEGAVIPAAVGVDIGCGMVAAELDSRPTTCRTTSGGCSAGSSAPAGVGQGDEVAGNRADKELADNQPATTLTAGQAKKAAKQLGSLGSGTHFFEVCLDERARVWIVLHSGSRGIGNELAQMHIAKSKRLAKDLHLRLALGAGRRAATSSVAGATPPAGRRARTAPAGATAARRRRSSSPPTTAPARWRARCGSRGAPTRSSTRSRRPTRTSTS